MTESGYYSMIVRPPNEVSKQVQELVSKTSDGPALSDPHMSIGSSFYSDDPDFIRKTGEWFEAQKPFEFTLEDIRNFRRSLIYLTSKSDEEIKRFMELHNGIRDLFETDFIYKNSEFTPHMTLVRSVPKGKLEFIESAIAEMIDSPWPMMVQNVDIQIKTESKRWKTLESFVLGKRSSLKGPDGGVPLEEYNFLKSGRASVQPIQ